MNREFIKLKRCPHNWKGKDWSHHKTFGATQEQPKNWLTPILNQGSKPSCTAYTAAAIREAQTKKQYDPELQWLAELRFVGNNQANGVDLDSQMATGVSVGFYPLGTTTPTDKAGGFLNVYPTKNLFNPSGMDTFDACVEALKIAPLSIGVTWYHDWDNAPRGIIPHTFNNKLGDHNSKLGTVEYVDGEYLVMQGSWGEGFGQNGLFKWDRYMVNKCWTLGIKYWTDNVPENVKTMGLLLSLYMNLRNLLIQLSIRMGNSFGLFK